MRPANWGHNCYTVCKLWPDATLDINQQWNTMPILRLSQDRQQIPDCCWPISCTTRTIVECRFCWQDFPYFLTIYLETRGVYIWIIKQSLNFLKWFFYRFGMWNANLFCVVFSRSNKMCFRTFEKKLNVKKNCPVNLNNYYYRNLNTCWILKIQLVVNIMNTEI